MDNTDVSGVMDDSAQDSGSIVNDNLPKTQADLDELIGREKLKERDKLRREMQAQQASSQSQVAAKVAPENQATSIDSDQIDEIVNSKIAQTLQKRQADADAKAHEEEMGRVADKFFTGFNKGKAKYEDFEDVIADFDPVEFPQLVHAVSGLDNVADVMYELANDPRKLEKINGWLRTMPERGRRELAKLSASIRDNDTAIDEYQDAPEPLSQTKSSNVSAGSGLSKLEQLKQSGRFNY